MDPYRALFLRQVRQIATSKPGRASLHQLLRTVEPELTLDDVESPLTRKRAFGQLKKRILQNGRNEDADAADELYFEVGEFFDACCRVMDAPVATRIGADIKTPAPIQTPSFPPDFNVVEKWPFICYHHPVIPEMGNLADRNSTLDVFMGYKCINARGCVAHGTKPGLFYGWSKVEQDSARCVNAGHLFSEKFQGARRLVGKNAIKEELTTRGPVISTSFVLAPNYVSSSENMSSFLEDRIGKNHPVVIVGWELTAFGEVWRAIACDDTVIPIAFGQFGIDEACIAPVSNLEHVSWQSGPFLDLDVSNWPVDWMSWTEPEFLLTSDQLATLSERLDEGFRSVKGKRARFVVRDKTKLAHSRVWYLDDIKWDPTAKKWNITASITPVVEQAVEPCI